MSKTSKICKYSIWDLSRDVTLYRRLSKLCAAKAGGLEIDSLIALVKSEMIARCQARQSADIYAREA